MSKCKMTFEKCDGCKYSSWFSDGSDEKGRYALLECEVTGDRIQIDRCPYDYKEGNRKPKENFAIWKESTARRRWELGR